MDEEDYLKATIIFNTRFHPEDFQYLFRVLPNRSVNTSQWDDQIKFWSTIIKKWGAETRVVEFSVTKLQEAFKYQSVIPTIKPSIQYLESQKVIKKKDDVKSKSLVRSIANALIGLVVSRDCDEYVFVNNLRLLVDELIHGILNHASGLLDTVLTNEEIIEKVPGISQDILFSELERSRGVKKYENGFYFPTKRIQHVTNELVQVILNDKKNMFSLVKQINELQDKINIQKSLAVKCAKRGHKSEAKTHLKMMKILEQQEYQTNQLYTKQMQLLYQKVDNEIAMRVASHYEENTKYLQQVTSQINEDELYKNMDEMYQYGEVTNAVANQQQQYSMEDEKELEDELQQLMQNESGRRRSNEQQHYYGYNMGQMNNENNYNERIMAYYPG
ncbi:SNF7 family protein [Histomonas meleagridis]|uniref:SNF7 family protein n=1 Tax=Histomonas meleagridis TaxID=135588 RepID=UPI00355A4AC3|nr:SNF7 family protein [Histomonas meleagridis]KAH0801663.1 SNF7 family protein [Histomonas meleagridis]